MWLTFTFTISVLYNNVNAEFKGSYDCRSNFCLLKFIKPNFTSTKFTKVNSISKWIQTNIYIYEKWLQKKNTVYAPYTHAIKQ